MTPDRLDEIRERVAKATGGPWAKNPFTAHVDAFDQEYPLPVCALLWPTDLRPEWQVIADGEFIAHARQDIPDLLAALAAAKAERDQWKALDDMHVSRINRLEAENERFRRGLETLATTFYKEDQHQDYARHVLGPARNALGGDNG